MNLMVLFGVFIFFLILAWPITVFILINRLSMTLIKSKVILKLIPSKILLAIKEDEKFHASEHHKHTN